MVCRQPWKDEKQKKTKRFQTTIHGPETQRMQWFVDNDESTKNTMNTMVC